MLGSAFISLFYKFIPTTAFISINSLFVYALPYILFTRNPYNLEESKKKDDLEKVKQKGGAQNFENPNKIDAYNRMM
jgi:hypothetical protein